MVLPDTTENYASVEKTIKHLIVDTEIIKAYVLFQLFPNIHNVQ